MNSDSSEKSLIRITIILIFVALILRADLTLHRRINADEFQHLHASWMIHLGKIPYQDFWENHMPLLYYGVQPILRVAGEGISTLLIVRALLSVSALGSLWIVYLLARLQWDKLTALFAVMILSYSHIFLQKTIEFRPDQLLVLCWLISLYTLLKFKFTIRANIGSGVLLGAAMLFSPKALLCFAAMILMLLVHLFWGKAKHFWINSVSKTTAFTVGFLIPPSLLALYFFKTGGLESFLTSTILQNLTYPNLRRPAFLLLPQNLGLLLLGMGGMLLSWRDSHKSHSNEEVPSWILAVPGLFLLAIIIRVVPAQFPQSALVFVPIFALYGGYAFRAALQSRKLLRVSLVLLFGMIVPVASLIATRPFTKTNREQLALIRLVLENTNPQEPVFDGNAAYVFRPQAYFYGSLVEGLRYKIKKGEITEEIDASLRKNRCRIVLYDDRVSDLPEQTQQYIRSNYIPHSDGIVFIAGKELGPEHFSGTRATFRMDIPLVYNIENITGDFEIDGAVYTGPVFLERGIHQLTSTEQLMRVTIRGVSGAGASSANLK